MGRFFGIDAKRLTQDSLRIIGDSREWCTVYRKASGASSEEEIARFWGRIANIARQTTGLEQSLVPSDVTGSLWVLLAPPNVATLLHRDEVRSNGVRWRIIHVRRMPTGQVAVLGNIQ